MDDEEQLGPPPGHQWSRYKVIELSTVSDVELTRILNHWSARGWTFESIQFAMRAASRRPAMAFVLFTRPWTGPLPTDDP